MIPSRALIGLLAAWTALAVPATAWPALFRGPWAWSGLTLLGVALLDAVLARLQPPPALARSQRAARNRPSPSAAGPPWARNQSSAVVARSW